MRKSKIHGYYFIIVSIILLTFVCFVLGCKKNEDIEETTGDFITSSARIIGAGNDIEIHKNVQRAISCWENRIIDPEPILVFAFLIRGGDLESSPLYFNILTYYEGSDVVGIGIIEKYLVDGKIQDTLTEEYPVFNHRNLFKDAYGLAVPVKKRDDGQRKSEQQWQEYIQGKGINDLARVIQSAQNWKATLPDVWFSVPEPNKLEVEVYLYDIAGHKSQPVNLKIYKSYYPQGE